MSDGAAPEGRAHGPAGELPPGVALGAGTVVRGDRAFHKYRSKQQPGLRIGANCSMDHVQFAVGEQGRIEIGDCCAFTCAILLCELELRIGDYVVIGWNATIADSDFHPVDPVQRSADALALSPLGRGRPRPLIPTAPVCIEDRAWIGPNAVILKGVRIGAGAWIEAGSLITHDVPARARMLGNPACQIGEV
jgi:acetyltransferase-like isoleucine patch superfamily enzyme